MYAGANEVVLPAHVGAERVAEMILYPAAATTMHRGGRTGVMEQELHSLGLELELVVAETGSAFTGRTVDEIENQVGPAFFIVAIDRPSGTSCQLGLRHGRTIALSEVVRCPPRPAVQ